MVRNNADSVLEMLNSTRKFFMEDSSEMLPVCILFPYDSTQIFKSQCVNRAFISMRISRAIAMNTRFELLTENIVAVNFRIIHIIFTEFFI